MNAERKHLPRTGLLSLAIIYIIWGSTYLAIRIAVREGSDWDIESWSAEGSVDECLADFAGWHDTIQTLIRNLRTPYKWALFSREPMAGWSRDRVSLLGDTRAC